MHLHKSSELNGHVCIDMFGFSMLMVEGKNEVVAPALMSLALRTLGGAMKWRNQ